MKFNPRIVAALIFGIILIGGSFYLSKINNTNKSDSQLVASTGELSGSFRNFIDVKDKDRNGLPDWQESLNLNTINLDESSSEKSNQTADLAVELATLTNSQNGNANSILSDIGTRLARESYNKQYSQKDIKSSPDNGPYALRTYGNKIASIMFENAPPKGTEDELTILNRAFLRNEKEILNGLTPTIESYDASIKAMLNISVPSSLEREHLALVNVYQALYADITAFQTVFDDALPAMTRFRRYQADAEALYLAITMLYGKLNQSGIQWTSNDIASKLIKVE